MKRALIVVDMQNDFLPGGALAVPQGDRIVPYVAGLLRAESAYSLFVFSQDWHPPDHGSFASAHEGAKPFQPGELAGEEQMLWPDHCVAETDGARLCPPVEQALSELIAAGGQVHRVKKGQDREVDSYSAFFDNRRRHDTGLAAALRVHGIGLVEVVGLALDYCVRATALDAAALGFTTRVLLRGTRPVEPAAEKAVVAELTAAGVSCLTA